MGSNERTIFWLCVILTMAMAFTALMISLPRVCNIHSTINFDYQTMIVTILGIFVTALMGGKFGKRLCRKNNLTILTKRLKNKRLALFTSICIMCFCFKDSMRKVKTMRLLSTF